MSFDVGALVKARGREWVVLPQSDPDSHLLVLRPLGGTEDDACGIYIGPGANHQPLEIVEPARFPLPNPQNDMGNQRSCGLLRDAVRLGFRSGAGPFRSLARIAVEPRPYQLVPLLMALKLDPVRLLIADDVGIGKTVEACMVARELLDRGEVTRMTVLCPPHLAEQWQLALASQFHIHAETVLSGTAARLERACRQDQSLFERYAFTVVSTDYIKSERRRHEFLRTCPPLVIVDEAHTCSAAPGHSIRQRRHELLQQLVNPHKEECAARHLIMVTATPHSGNEEAFRSLLALLHPDLAHLPQDLSGEENRKHRENLARFFVQRRRGDLEAYLDTVTPFPTRETAEETYTMQKPYRDFMDQVLTYARESVLDPTLEKRQQRIRWWSALALLRAISSSPMAAAATLRNRAACSEGETLEEVDAQGRRSVCDVDDQSQEGGDTVPGSDSGEESEAQRRRLRAFARQAESLALNHDAKLKKTLDLVKEFLDLGYSPILFCRFIPTVDYVTEFLRKKLQRQNVQVDGITGQLPAEERIHRVMDLADHPRRVLVCTDCLSEGINLQDHFDAVMHYDLAWNPTRHEQREGRVDRYGQPKSHVRTLTFYGQDNPVDGIVLDVLLRKHKTIHAQLGIIVPIPMETQVVEDAILEGLLIREQTDALQMSFDFVLDTHRVWDVAAEREKKSRTLFAQNRMLKAVNEEVRHELDQVRQSMGSISDVQRFTQHAFEALGAGLKGEDPMQINLGSLPHALKEALSSEECIQVAFTQTLPPPTHMLTRTHPLIESLASHVMETALDPKLDGPGKRCGVIRTSAVTIRTTLILLRLRFHINNQGRDGTQRPLLAEDLALIGFTGSPHAAQWLDEPMLESLLHARADANIDPEAARDAVQRILDDFESLKTHLDEVADARGQALLDAHRRVRLATKSGVRALSVDVHKPADVLGLYIYLPARPGGVA